MNPDNANGVLQHTVHMLEKMNVTYWIDSGTLLAAYRDGKINEYDHDIDISVFEKDFGLQAGAELMKTLWLAGYSILRDLGDAKLQFLAYHKDEVLLDLKFCYVDKDHLWNWCFASTEGQKSVLHLYPERFFREFETINFLGRDYPCPSPLEEYLECHYGPDWREFKVRKDQAGETDLSWDYMKDPPCCVSPSKFKEMKGYELPIKLWPR